MEIREKASLGGKESVVARHLLILANMDTWFW